MDAPYLTPQEKAAQVAIEAVDDNSGETTREASRLYLVAGAIIERLAARGLLATDVPPPANPPADAAKPKGK